MRIGQNLGKETDGVVFSGVCAPSYAAKRLLRPDQALSAVLIAANGGGFTELFDDVSDWGAGLSGLELRTATECKREYYR